MKSTKEKFIKKFNHFFNELFIAPPFELDFLEKLEQFEFVNIESNYKSEISRLAGTVVLIEKGEIESLNEDEIYLGTEIIKELKKDITKN